MANSSFWYLELSQFLLCFSGDQRTPREKLSLRWLQPRTSPACKLEWSILSKGGYTKTTRFQASFHASTCFVPNSIPKGQTQLVPSVQRAAEQHRVFLQQEKGADTHITRVPEHTYELHVQAEKYK